MINETINSGENFAVSVNNTRVLGDTNFAEPGVLYGHTKIYRNDELVVDKRNAIFGGSGTTSPTGLKAYLAQVLSANVDRALANAKLFTTGDVNILTGANPQLTNHGIMVMADANDYGNNTAPVLTMLTYGPSSSAPNAQVAANTYGRKFKGVLTATAPRQIGYAVLGHDAKVIGDFGTLFATQSFQTITLAVGDTLTIEWEVYIA
jgi:hypothetical protein